MFKLLQNIHEELPFRMYSSVALKTFPMLYSHQHGSSLELLLITPDWDSMPITPLLLIPFLLLCSVFVNLTIPGMV